MKGTSPQRCTADLVRLRIEDGGERLWRYRDFQDLPFAAVAQALCRLARTKCVRRLSRGIYFRPRQTAFGESLPSPAALHELAAQQSPIFPAGLAAAGLLGFTSQSARLAEVATTAGSLPRALVGDDTIVHTHRPPAWRHLSREDAALLDILRHGGKTSELPPAETTRRMLALLATDDRLARLTAISDSEPPRVRALLGALAEATGASPRTLTRLRRSLNPASRFDFGLFAGLPAARTWQAKAGGPP